MFTKGSLSGLWLLVLLTAPVSYALDCSTSFDQSCLSDYQSGAIEADQQQRLKELDDFQKTDEISGTGGARKVRFARRGQGKSGGYRVITFYSGVDIPVFLITMFAKNEKSNISQAEKNAMRKGLKALAEHYRGKEDDKGR